MKGYVTKEHDIYVLDNKDNLSHNELINNLENNKIDGKFMRVDELDVETSYLVQPIPEDNKNMFNYEVSDMKSTLYGLMLSNNSINKISNGVYEIDVLHSNLKYYKNLNIINTEELKYHYRLRIRTSEEYLFTKKFNKDYLLMDKNSTLNFLMDYFIKIWKQQISIYYISIIIMI